MNSLSNSQSGLIVVTGASGQLGTDLEGLLQRAGLEHISLDRNTLDISNAASINEQIPNNATWIINCAAYTNVNEAEQFPDDAALVNVKGVELLAKRSREIGANFAHISTDYVFDGTKNTPYLETDLPNPLNVYGRTKYQGELAAMEILPERTWVIRTSWLYSAMPQSFVSKILSKLKANELIEVVSDQIGSPTRSKDLASAIIQLIQKDTLPESGIYHYANSGHASWYEFALEIANKYQYNVNEIKATASVNLLGTAIRPKYSVLSTQKWSQNGFTAPSDWTVALRKYVAESKHTHHVDS